MKVALSNVPGLMALWEAQRMRYTPGFFMILFLGEGSSADQFVLKYLQTHEPMLDNMSGPYASLTVMTPQSSERLQAPGNSSRASDLNYLHLSPVPKNDPDEDITIYDLAQSLSVPLDSFPALFVSPDPWAYGKAHLFDLGELISALGEDASDQARTDLISEFFSAVFSASRESENLGAPKRLRSLAKRAEDIYPKTPGRFRAAIESGFIAQVVEGLVKGFTPS